MSTVLRTGVAVTALALVAACDAQPSADAPGGPITVTATDTACQVSATTAPPGNVTFQIVNQGTKVAEFYLYGEGDRIMGEVENIAPGLNRRLIVEVAGSGTDQTACKPGMAGTGIRGTFTVTGGVAKGTDANAELADTAAATPVTSAARPSRSPRSRRSSLRPSSPGMSPAPRRSTPARASTTSGSSRSRPSSATSTRPSTSAKPISNPAGSSLASTASKRTCGSPAGNRIRAPLCS